MREIRFRAWEKYEKKMYLLDLPQISMFSNSNCYDLMQYTGLKDKHGKEIFELDIIHRPDIGIPMVVRWNEKKAEFDLAMRDPSDFDAVTIFYTQFAHDYEIIGNFYEHSHLLLPDPH